MLKMGTMALKNLEKTRNGSGERSMMSVSKLSLDVKLGLVLLSDTWGWGCRFYDPLSSPQTGDLEMQ
jgi:hypothetical protein